MTLLDNEYQQIFYLGFLRVKREKIILICLLQVWFYCNVNAVVNYYTANKERHVFGHLHDVIDHSDKKGGIKIE